MSSKKHKVVIVGGGVAGVKTAMLLARDALYEVTLITKKKSFEHRTSLYRDKRGRSRRHVKIPLEKIFERRKFDLDLVRATITEVNPQKQFVTDENGTSYAYDSLIVALEGDSRIPGNFDSEHTYSAYNASDMSDLRREIAMQFEVGDVQHNFVVIGAGEAGIEMAYELSLLLEGLSKQYSVDRKNYHIVLVEKDKRILATGSAKASAIVQKRLEQRGIKVFTSQEVIELKDGYITFSNGQKVKSGIAILAAGTRANKFFANNSETFLLDEYGFVRVTPILEAEGHSNIYVIGNSKASEYRLGVNGKLYDAHYVVDLLHEKRYAKDIPDYDPPHYEPRMQLGHFWGVYHNNGHALVGTAGWARKRWLDRMLFSTLLPRRAHLEVWILGSKHDED